MPTPPRQSKILVSALGLSLWLTVPAVFLLAFPAVFLVAPQANAQPASFAPIVKAQRDKVVHITTGEGRHGGPGMRQGMGSGFIISANGDIVTNHHVISNSARIQVVLADERSFTARVVGSDEQTDLALLHIDAEKLPAARFGNSDRVEVGDWVIAIGNPLGLEHTVTAGIISAKGRNLLDSQNTAFGEFLQTDAAINPGNSGGPLFDLQGRVIGVNSAVSRHGQGIGFAVPSNLAIAVLEQLRRFGYVRRGWLGISIQETDAAFAQKNNLPEGARGLLVNGLQPGSPGADRGLRVGDLLTRFGSHTLREVSQLQKLVALTLPGTRVRLRGMRRTPGRSQWRPFDVTLELGHNPRNPDETQPTVMGRLGVILEGPGAPRAPKTAGRDAGVRVRSVTEGSMGQELGLRAGDVILQVAGEPVTGAPMLEQALRSADTVRVALQVRRGRRIIYLVARRSLWNP